MNEGVELPISYKGEELLFPVHLQQRGYTHHIAVDVYGQQVFFEPDEECHYQAVIEEKPNKQVTVELLQAIITAIEALFK